MRKIPRERKVLVTSRRSINGARLGENRERKKIINVTDKSEMNTVKKKKQHNRLTMSHLRYSGMSH